MTEHDEDAVVERAAMAALGTFTTGANGPIPGTADDWRKAGQNALRSLKPGDRLPGGLVCVPAEPTPEMIAKTLPMMGVHCAPAEMRLAERALFLLEPKDFAVESHRSGIDAALALISDYRAMLSAATTNDRGQNADDS